MQYVDRLWDVNNFTAIVISYHRATMIYKVIQPFKLIAVKIKRYSDCAISNF